MQLELKPIDEQVIVITGASSGIGLVTARIAARRGACIVLAAPVRRHLLGAGVR
jgi:NAD(P)-dependent dehydrogenase (short-subunit alcohol dehydrogenase family)